MSGSLLEYESAMRNMTLLCKESITDQVEDEEGCPADKEGADDHAEGLGALFVFAVPFALLLHVFVAGGGAAIMNTQREEHDGREGGRGVDCCRRSVWSRE